MKKIFTIASIGLVALTIFGCKKKTTKNTTKENTTVTTKTNTSKTNTTRKTTTEKQTTINKKEFKEVNYETFMQKVNSIDSSKANYVKAVINGSTKNNFSNTIDRDFIDYTYRLNEDGEFVANDGGSTALQSYFDNQLLKSVPNDEEFKFYINDNNEFQVTQYSNLYVEGKYATIYYTFNEFGYLVKKETKDIVDDDSETEYSNSVDNFEINWFKEDSFDGYERITKDEADEIVNDYENKDNAYIGAYMTGTYTNLYTGVSHSLMHTASYYDNSTQYYHPYDETIDSYVHAEYYAYRPQNLYNGDNTFYYKNSDNELAMIIYRKAYDADLYVERTVKFNEFGFAKRLKDEIIVKASVTSTFIVSDYEVEFLKNEPTITITLNAGLGTFSNNQKEIKLNVIAGTTLTNLKTLDEYETPTLEGAGIAYSAEWFDSNNALFETGKPIYKDSSFTYGFIDNDYTNTPVATFDLSNQIFNGNDLIDFGVDYINSENKGILVMFGSTMYYSMTNELAFKPYGSTLISIWGAYDSFSLSNEEGVYSEGNNYIRSISCIHPIHIKDYAFSGLTRLETFQQGTFTEMEYNIGDYAFYNSSNLYNFSTPRIVPTTIGNYAFAKTNLGGNEGFISGKLLDATMIKEGAFANIPSLKYLFKELVLDYDEENNTHSINSKTYNYKNWEENYNGFGENRPELKFYYNTFNLDEEINLYLSSSEKDINNLVFNLFNSEAYDIEVSVSTDGASNVVLKLLGDDTRISSADKEESIYKQNYTTGSETYSLLYELTINNSLAIEDEYIFIHISYHKEEEYREVNHSDFISAFNEVKGTDNYYQMFVNGIVIDGSKRENYDDELYMKASDGNFHGDISKDGIEDIIYNNFKGYSSDRKYYISSYGNFKIETKVKLSDTKEGLIVCIYNQFGLLTSIKTENITTVESSELEIESVEYDLDMTYSENKVVDGYTLISFDEAKEIGASQVANNIYLGATLNGTEYDLKTEQTRTITNLTLMKDFESTDSFTSSDSSITKVFNMNRGSALYINYGLYFKDSNGNLRLTYYYNYSSGSIYTKTDIFYNEYGYIVSYTTEIIEKNKDFTIDGYKIHSFEVEYQEEYPGIMVTFHSGLATFPDGSKTIQVPVRPGRNQLYYVMQEKEYKEPIMPSGLSSFRGFSWATENGEAYNQGLYISESMDLIFVVVDSGTPQFEFTFNNAAAKNALEEGHEGATTVSFKIYFDEEVPACGIVIFDDNYTNYPSYYLTDNLKDGVFTTTINSNADELTIGIWGTVVKYELFEVIDSTLSLYSYGNSFITEQKTIRSN